MSTRGHSVPELVVKLAVLTLPAQHRDRYRAEFGAELHFLARRERVVYALRILARTWALHAALTAQPETIGETAMARKPLRCRLDMHKWTRRQNEEDGTRYMECTRCHDQRGLRNSLPGIVG